jgi:hypothetical protein
MSAPTNPFTLAGWRRTVAAQYAMLRIPEDDRVAQAREFRRARDDLFRSHPESPIAPERRSAWPRQAGDG